ncbi:MAG: hypothetical protein HQ562_06825 [Candidatus Marinimicrobia bacterium]|nr:hypothetical protein [Candidatus Neomarinimicrobiota bacterium]
MDYEALVDLVKNNQGRLTLDLVAVDIDREANTNFTNSGLSCAWTKKMQGGYNGALPVELVTTDTGRYTKRNILGIGYGFAWAKKMRGKLGDMEFDLIATRVIKKREKRLLAFGYSYAWVEQMTGEIGPRLKLRFTTTDVGQEKKSSFLGFGSGFGWSNKAELVITLYEALPRRFKGN